MKRIGSTLLPCAVALAAIILPARAPGDDAFVYQGTLSQSGQPMNGEVEVVVRLYDIPSGGVQLSTNTFPVIGVSDGALNLELDFGPLFDGSDRWLEIEIEGQILAPRQKIFPTPYALHAQIAEFALDVSPGAVPFTFNGPHAEFIGGNVSIGAAPAGDALLSLRDSPNVDGVFLITETFGQFGNDLMRISGNSIDTEHSSGAPSRPLILNGNSPNDVGVNFDQPDARLGVHKDFGDSSPVLRLSTDTGAGFNSELTFDRASINAGSTITPNSPLRLNDGSSGPIVMALGGGGVGIGTALPKGRLHVVGDYYGTGHFYLHAFEGDGNSGTAYVQARDDSGTSTIGLQLRTQISGAFQNVMRLTPAGDVGIGTTTPGAKLHVNGAVAAGSISGSNLSVTNAAPTTVANFTNDGASPATIQATNLAVNGKAGQFNGNVEVTGSLSKGSGDFKIDHPLDPENWYLRHSFVESPDMMNVYNGNVVTDAQGYATVELPEWFEALNRDFRYQLTVIGEFAQAIIANKIEDNRFVIRTDRSEIEVSWQVTGIRRDPYAEWNPVIVEEEKPDEERGYYLHPEAYGLGSERGIAAVRAAASGQEVEVADGR